jgi:hypothetical protein
LATILAIAPHAPPVFAALYKNHDEEYLDAIGNLLLGWQYEYL